MPDDEDGPDETDVDAVLHEFKGDHHCVAGRHHRVVIR